MTIVIYHPVNVVDEISMFIEKTILEIKLNISLEIIGSTDLDIFKKTINEIQPEIVIVHCHNENRDFQIIRSLSKKIKKELHKTLLFVDHDDCIEYGYYEKNIWGYEADHIVTSHRGYLLFDDETFEIIKNHLGKIY